MFLNRSNKSDITHLTEKNIEQYVEKEYGYNNFVIKDVCIDNFIPLLQKDYGGKNDCTLTCITAIINHLTKGKNYVAKIYDDVEKIAKRYLYNDKFGTSYLTIKSIFNNSLNKFSSKKAKVGYMKNVGYNQNTIISKINSKTPLILSLFNDGLGYYKKHSVVITGYKIYSIGGQRKTFLCIYDNWSKNISYLDYDKISSISVLHYIA